MRIARRRWMPSLALALVGATALATPAAAEFPAEDRGYHTYAEVTSETLAITQAYPAIVRRVTLGRSFEGRDLWALKVSDNVGVNEAEPEVLIDANQHAREHLTVEQAMYLLNELTSQYASDQRIRDVVDSREIWIVPTVNPDGAEYDVATGRYASWRKNRQPNPPSPSIGTDLNRNWGWQWGCCDGSSSNPASEEFRGATPFGAPETRALRDFVVWRRVGGVQQIKASIDFHSYGELVMWPFAYLFADTAPGMTQDQRDAFAALGTSMAQTNAYKPQQASELYISDGNLRDWLWGSESIFAYGFEMWGGSFGFYPPDENIPAQTSRNREAVLRLLEIADCPYRSTGTEEQYCGAGSSAGTVTPGGIETDPPVPPPPPPPIPPPPLAAAAGSAARLTARPAAGVAATTGRATAAAGDHPREPGRQRRRQRRARDGRDRGHASEPRRERARPAARALHDGHRTELPRRAQARGTAAGHEQVRDAREDELRRHGRDAIGEAAPGPEVPSRAAPPHRVHGHRDDHVTAGGDRRDHDRIGASEARAPARIEVSRWIDAADASTLSLVNGGSSWSACRASRSRPTDNRPPGSRCLAAHP